MALEIPVNPDDVIQHLSETIKMLIVENAVLTVANRRLMMEAEQNDTPPEA